MSINRKEIKMSFDEFKSKFGKLPLISTEHLKLSSEDTQAMRNQLVRWIKNGKILRLKRNLYSLNQNDRKIEPSRAFIASELYRSSYLSLEYALSFYGIIPEKSADVTSVTSKKTSVFSNVYGKFIYQHIKLECFTGFKELKDEAGLPYYMAFPEKALADFLYLNQAVFTKDYKKILTKSYRIQKPDNFNAKLFNGYVSLFKSGKLKRIAEEVNKL